MDDGVTLTRTTPLKRKRVVPRRHRRPLCTRQRCTRPALIDDLCRHHLVLANDEMARVASINRDGCCTACGTTANLQHSHHFRRSCWVIRWDERNSTTHCAACHKRFTEHPALHTEWIRAYIGEATYQQLFDLAYGPIDGSTGRRHGPERFTDQDVVDWYERLRGTS